MCAHTQVRRKRLFNFCLKSKKVRQNQINSFFFPEKLFSLPIDFIFVLYTPRHNVCKSRSFVLEAVLLYLFVRDEN